MLTTLLATTLIAIQPANTAHATDAQSPPTPEPVAPINFPEHAISVALDSGPRIAAPGGDDLQLVFSEVIAVDDAPYIRLVFGDLTLPTAPASSDDAFVEITSLQDGASQQLDATSAAQWQGMSAYFNGNAVRVDLYASPGAAPAHVSVTDVIAGEWRAAPRSLCGSVDDRELSTDPRIGRMMPEGCTVWLFNDRANCLLTAGHCGPASNQVIQFNVPLSDSNGAPVAPPPEDQYPIDPVSIQTTGNAGVGGDWATFGVFNNANTGLSPLAAQGASYQLAASAPLVSGQTIRITGFGSTSAPVPREWDAAQKTHTGPYVSVSSTTIKYEVDTTGGNSGSPVLDLTTGMAIGIHTHAGCSSGGNQGTAIHVPALQDAINNPQGVCVPPTLTFTYPFGRPDTISPEGIDTVRVVIGADSGIELQPNTARLHVDDGTGEQIVMMTEIAPATYEGVFPEVLCGGVIEYFVTAQDTEGRVYFDPRAAPGDPYTALVGHEVAFIANLDFETGTGWSVENSQLLTSGEWERAVPVVGAEGAPQEDYDLSGHCWLTQNALTGSDVDWGPTRLLSPVYDLSGMNAPIVSYARWLYNNSGDGDEMVVEVSDDGGDSWVHLETVSDSDQSWVVAEASLNGLIEINDSFRIRFSVSDNPNNSLLESGIDTFQIFEAVCNVPCTEADFGVPYGVLDITDVLEFLIAFDAQDPVADLAPSFGEFDIDDIIAFLMSFGAGCP